MKRPPDQAVRERVTRDFSTTFLLEAGAGTGKTTVMVDRVVALVQSGAATLDRIVAITFTEKAAGELKLRLRDELEAALGEASGAERDRLARATSDLERAPVSTIHAFASALLKERPFEAGLDPGFAVAAEVAGQRTFEDAWVRWLDQQISAGHDILVRALHLGLTLDKLQEAARRMVAERDLLGLPVPRPPFDPAALLGELRRSLPGLKGKAGSCLDDSDGAFRSIEALEAFLLRAARLEGPGLEGFLRGLYIRPGAGNQGNWKPKSVCAEVKAELKRLAEAAAKYGEDSDADVAAGLRQLLGGFLGAYEAEKRERSLVDFQDLLLRTRDVLARSLPVRRYFQGRFDRILVDEFQDTDPLQAEIAFLLAEDPAAPPAADWRGVRLAPGKLFVVGDPKQSVYRFRRADLAIYDEVKRLIVNSGGEVLPLTTNFRTVPSILGFVNERFDAVFTVPGDPTPRALDPHRDEAEPKAARAVALSLPAERMPAERTVTALRPLVAETIAAFIDQVTRVAPWQVVDAGTRAPRPARPGDVALLVRKMTADFIAPFEDQLRRRGIGYRLVGGKEYYAREEVRALAAVLRAVDNPADRLSLVVALRSPFFGVSDDELLRFAAGNGNLNLLAPVADAAPGAPLFRGLFDLLGRLHRQRRIDPPSAVIAELFARSRSLAGFLLRPDGAQRVANLWRVLEVARAYEAAAPVTLRAFARFLEEEVGSGREEGDAPVGEQVGATVEVITVHRAKGLEYPIVVLADLLTEKIPEASAILDHTAGQGWLKIGRFAPAGWAARAKWETAQQEAEGRRLLYVALTRARDHLVIPCLPGERKASWLDQACAGFVTAGQAPPLGKRTRTVRDDGTAGAAEVTWFDTRPLRFDVAPASAPRSSIAIEGTAAEAAASLSIEKAWAASSKAARKAARDRPAALAVTEVAEPRPTASAASGLGPGFGRLVHEILATVDLAAADVTPTARALARLRGLTEAQADHAAALVSRTLALPLFAEVRAAARVCRELPFTCVLDGETVTGRIDLAFESAGRWTVVDFKTADAGADPALAVEAHGPQLEVYRRALAALTRAEVAGRVVVVSDGGTAVGGSG